MVLADVVGLVDGNETELTDWVGETGGDGADGLFKSVFISRFEASLTMVIGTPLILNYIKKKFTKSAKV
jgi:hypothetical protein